MFQFLAGACVYLLLPASVVLIWGGLQGDNGVSLLEAVFFVFGGILCLYLAFWIMGKFNWK
jgi:hypothetical protein